MEKIKQNKKKLFYIIALSLFLIGVSTFAAVSFLNKSHKIQKLDGVTEKINNNYQEEQEDIKDETKEENLSEEEEQKKEEESNNQENSPSDHNNNIESNQEKSDTGNNQSDDRNNNSMSQGQDTKIEPPIPPKDPITTPSPTPSPTPINKNHIKRQQIENTYHVKILYGNEIGSYQPKGATITRLTDEADIENYLSRVSMELAKYPTGFFQDFNKKGMPLTIYLIKSANGAFSGFTDYQFMNDIKLTMATDYEFEYTLHHELMHYIDCYLDIVMYPNSPYTEYEALNPVGFSYGNALTEQIYHMANNQRGAYFISQYATSHVKEDRAEVFKFMMARAYAPIGCFNQGETIRKKAQVISNQIKAYFPSVSGTAHWDRFIK